MVFKRYLVMLVVRLLLVGFAMALVVWLLLKPGFHSSTLLSSIVLLLLVTELWRFVSRTNREVARFLDAVRFADYSQRFDFEDAGSGFADLGRTFTEIMEQLKSRRDGACGRFAHAAEQRRETPLRCGACDACRRPAAIRRGLRARRRRGDPG
jgi:hypothetical protein